jgi:hypothetical protein
VLERAETSDAREVVEGLASAKAEDWLSREARAVLWRLDHQRAK